MNTEKCVPPTGAVETAGLGEPVAVRGPLTVADAEHWRVRLTAELGQAGALSIDLGEVTTIDVFGLQLLHAAEQAAGIAGRPFRLLNAPDHVAAARAAAGFAHTRVTSAEQTP